MRYKTEIMTLVPELILDRLVSICIDMKCEHEMMIIGHFFLNGSGNGWSQCAICV